MKTYNVTYDRKKNRGVYGISLVENPAMEETFIALSKQKNVIRLSTIDKEKRELIGLVLEPNKPIYRNQGGEEFNIVFSEDTVKELLIGFSQNSNQNNSTLEHQSELKLDGVTFFENWIVEDVENDKSNAFGLEAKKGSWITKLKVDNDILWDGFIKNGFVKGFSIDALVNLEEIKLNSDMSNKVELNDESKSWFTALFDKHFTPKKEEVKLEEEVKEEEKEEMQEEDDAPKNKISDEVKEEIMNAVAEKLMQMKSDISKEFETKFSKVESENTELKEKVVELGNQPAVVAVKSQAEQKKISLNKKDRIKEFLKNR